MSKYPSIFNDVIGPVMRGPSSSHTAASWRIAGLCLCILNEPLKNAVIAFDKDGAWASNYEEQGTTLGINGGLLGLDITDDQIKNHELLARERGLEIRYEITSFPTAHANTVRLTLEGVSGQKIVFQAISSGGGAFEIQKIDAYNVQLRGDYYELLIWFADNPSYISEIKKAFTDKDFRQFSRTVGGITLMHLKSSTAFSDKHIDYLKENLKNAQMVVLKPVLPIVAGNESPLPFADIPEMVSYAEQTGYSLGQLGVLYEKSLSGLPEASLIEEMQKRIKIIEGSIKTGLNGTKYDDRILPRQSHLISEAERENKILKEPVLNSILANVTAIMEAKSAMEVIVANPTAGSCGTVGGAISAIAVARDVSTDTLNRAYFAAGMIGAWFAEGPGFSAEAFGCQVECGAASGMAAAAIVELLGGTAKEAVDAASLAIQNMLGLICDPVADRVEVPCLGKNISAAMNAFASATMVRAGFNAVIPYDEVLQSVEQVGTLMPACVKCTGQGGLSITETSMRIKQELKRK